SQVESPAPAAPAPPRAAADAGPAPMSTTVAASTAGPEESLGSPRPDQDRFKVPPVFGLGSTAPSSPVVQRPVAADRNVGRTEPEATFPAITTPAADDAAVVDPIDEIENLIGRAMTVEFDLPADAVAVSDPEPVVAPPSPAPRPAPSPALRSLATPTLPVSAPSSLSTADQTIFAAAQASGAKVGWVTPSDARDAVPEDRETEAYQSAPRQRRGLGMSRALAGPVVAVTLLLAAGFGLYWVLGLSGREAGPAPLLTVDTAPTKQAAPAAGADGNSPPQSVVFSEMDGTTPAPDEQLLSRDQTDVNEVTQAATAVNGLNDEGLANRKVRTVKVRPDGTIVSGEDAVAGSTILPVDRPNVPAIAGAETTTTSLLANTGSLSPPPATTPAPQTASADVAITPVEPGSTVTAVDLAGNPIAGKTAVVPLQRPSGLRAAVVPQAATDATTLAAPEQVAATPTASPTIPGATEVEALGNTAPAYVQLASQRNEADARQSAQNMVTRYGPLFGGANLEVQRVDLGAKGIYYRVRVPANSLEQANLICTNVKAAGGDCFTM
ncbi:MAG: SPOR domain-containing protein, partial [Cypionkella sp.]